MTPRSEIIRIFHLRKHPMNPTCDRDEMLLQAQIMFAEWFVSDNYHANRDLQCLARAIRQLSEEIENCFEYPAFSVVIHLQVATEQGVPPVKDHVEMSIREALNRLPNGVEIINFSITPNTEEA